MAKPEVKQMIFTTDLVQKATDDINDGVVVKRYQNPWLKSEVGLRRSGVVFKMSEEEQEEYIKCAVDVNYFAEHYCKVKREDGSIGDIKLRDYQEDILNDFVQYRFNILMAARQTGKCVSFNTLCEFKNGDDILITRIGLLYYTILKTIRPLTFLEKCKIKLYNLLYKISDEMPTI